MKLNLNFYEEKNDEKNENLTNLIENYIEKYEPYTYEMHFGDDISSKELYYLSDLSENILNWYPFNLNDSVLEIGAGLGQLTTLLTRKCKEIVSIESNLNNAKAIEKRLKDVVNLEVIVGTLDKIKIVRKFKYITLIGIDSKISKLFNGNLNELLTMLQNYLDEDGKILLAVDNKFGIRFFAGEEEAILNKKFASLDGYYSSQNEIESFTRNSLENKLKESGYNYNFYYPFPDYKLPNVIFTDDTLPDYHTFERYLPYHTDNSAIMFNELHVFREILKDNKEQFKFFANSFFVEISKKEFVKKYNYISFNNLRKKEYRLVTKIAEKFVEKDIADKEAMNHYNNIKSNIELLENHNLKTLDIIEEGKIKSKYIKQELRLDNVLIKYLSENNIKEFEELLRKYIDIIFKDTYQEKNFDKTIFGKYNVDYENKNIIENLHFLKNGLWDMIFQNCFLVDNDFYFFDQEWNEECVPAEYILYRSIFYTLPLRKMLYAQDEKFGLKPYLELFEKLDSKIQKSIYDEKMWSFYFKNKCYDLDATKQEIINLNIQKEAIQGACDNYKKDYENLKKEYEQYRNRIQSIPLYKVYKLFKKGK